MNPPATPVSTTITWSKFRHLSDLIRQDRRKHASEKLQLAGVYAWGFYVGSHFVLWYVGKATEGTSIQTRLRDHYMSLIGARYKLPQCFMDKDSPRSFKTATAAWWDLDHDNRQRSDPLHQFSTLLPILKAGFRFAQEVQVSLGTVPEGADLTKVEAQLIRDLQPLVNTRSKKKGAGLLLDHAGRNDWPAEWQKLMNVEAHFKKLRDEFHRNPLILP